MLTITVNEVAGYARKTTAGVQGIERMTVAQALAEVRQAQRIVSSKTNASREVVCVIVGAK